jgi:hypothetical protein
MAFRGCGAECLSNSTISSCVHTYGMVVLSLAGAYVPCFLFLLCVLGLCCM